MGHPRGGAEERRGRPEAEVSGYPIRGTNRPQLLSIYNSGRKESAPRMKIPHRIALLLLLLAARLPAHAGCLAMPTVCAAYGSTPLIFRGRVVQIAPVPPPPPPPPPPGVIIGRGYDGGPYDHVRLQVLEVFKGDPGPEITILGSDRCSTKVVNSSFTPSPTTKKSLLLAPARAPDP